MSKKKKNNKKNHKTVNYSNILPSVENISISRYTYDAWMRSYPESNREEWEERVSPNCIADFLSHTINMLEGQVPDFENLTFVTLDDKFFKWLEENDLNNDEQSRLKYVAETSIDEAQALWEKNGMDREYRLFGLRVVMAGFSIKNKTTHFVINDDKRNAITKYLETLFGENNVWVSKMLLKADVFFNNVDLLENVGRQHLITGDSNIENCLSMFSQQTYMSDLINLMSFYIPVVIAKNIESCVFNIDSFLTNMESYYPEFVTLDENNPTFKNLFPLVNVENAFVVPCLIPPDEFLEVEEGFTNALKKEMKKAKKKLIFATED